MRGSVRLWSGWLLAAGIGTSLGLLGMAVGASPDPTCCPEPCQWVLSAPCCDLSAAVQAPLSSPSAPALAHLVRPATAIPAPNSRSVQRHGPARVSALPLGLRTTVLRL